MRHLWKTLVCLQDPETGDRTPIDEAHAYREGQNPECDVPFCGNTQFRNFEVAWFNYVDKSGKVCPDCAKEVWKLV